MAAAELERGREAFEGRAWRDAYSALGDADRETPLGPDDLELLATAAYMVGHDEEYFDLLGRAHQAHLDAAEPRRAMRCAFWIGVNLAREGEMGRAGGWLGRAQRLLERETEETVEHGYMVIPAIFEHEGKGDWEAAANTAGEAVEIGERFGDRDLFALAVHEQGHILIRIGRVQEGLRMLDEAMVAASAGELSPIVTGLVYCGVIAGCQEIYELRRAAEWTEVLTDWCDEQPDLVAFTGRCRVHRAEIMQLRGAWADALEEARRAGERAETTNREAAGEAAYRRGELHRLLGDLPAADEAYDEASRYGWEPQPGRALLRLAQGKTDAAVASIRRVVGETEQPLRRAALLPALVEVMLAAGDLEAAREGCADLAEICEGFESPTLAAMAVGTRGAVELAEGDARTALVSLRESARIWHELDAPYELARSRVLIASACGALGDDEAAELELETAREAFERLGAGPDLAGLASRPEAPAPAERHGLSPRELEVFGHLAAGKTNRAIATELVVSERTVDRHVSNIFAKLGVGTRAAATAYAYEHGLL